MCLPHHAIGNSCALSASDPLQITKDSLVVTQHLAGTVIFLSLTYLAKYKGLSLAYMLAADLALAVCGGSCLLFVTLYQSHVTTSGDVVPGGGGGGGVRNETSVTRLSEILRLRGASLHEYGAVLVVHVRATMLFVVALVMLSPLLRTLTMTISDDTVAAWASLLLMVSDHPQRLARCPARAYMHTRARERAHSYARTLI